MREQISAAEGGAYADLLAMIAESMKIIAKIASIKADLERLESATARTLAQNFRPAVPVEQSVFPDHLICLIDGARVTVLSRYIRRYALTPPMYRAIFRLPADYPMVPPAYSEERAEIARKSKMWTEVDHSTQRKRRKSAEALAVNQRKCDAIA